MARGRVCRRNPSSSCSTTGRSTSARRQPRPSRPGPTGSPSWLTVEWLPKYAPELNDIEVVWHDLKAHHLAHKTFTDAEALDRAIHAAVTSLNSERNVDPLAKQRISA
ncbi:transposase [Bradyrhizobium sp. USDA 10063]